MEQVLKECTEELQQKDSILEPTTARTLEQYVQVGGTLEDALDLMVGSFADIPTSLNKMMELLHLSGNRPQSCVCVCVLCVCVCVLCVCVCVCLCVLCVCVCV